MPSEKEKIFKFTNIQKQLRAPFVVYADFECILKEMDVETSSIGISEEGTSKTINYQQHVPCSYSYKVVSDIPDYQPELKLSDVSENVAKDFLDDIQNVADHIMTEYILKLKAKPHENQLSPEQKQYYLDGDCHICGEAIPSGDDVSFGERRVLDHCHFIDEPGKPFGKFRGPVHNNCNLRYKIDPKKVETTST